MHRLKRITIIGLMLFVRHGLRGQIISDYGGQSEELFPDNPGCNLVRDGCVYNAYCKKVFNVNYRSKMIQNGAYNCENLLHEINNEYFLPMDIFFKDGDFVPFNKNNEFERDYYNGKHYYHSPNVFVQSVDFSNNGYIDIPDITDLINLKKINISNNMLTIAMLSNSKSLDFLQEIDFSFNSIDTIEVQTSQRPYSNLKFLNLSHNSLTVIPEATLFYFIKLEQLDISFNLITNINNMAFLGLKQMSILNLSYNHLVNLNQSLAKLFMLKELYIQENKISTIQNNDIHSKKFLTSVNLSSNNIETIENGAFNNMSQLSVLDLKNNHLKFLQMDMFDNSNKLEYVDLSQNEITKLPIYTFKQKNISYFSIQGNKIEGNLAKGMFEGLKRVEKLDLSYQRVTSIDDVAFLGIENIYELLLNNNEISKVANRSFKLLTKLIRLDLSHNFISNFTFNTEDLISLEYLSLCNNIITYVEKTQLHSLNKLEFLDVSGNKIISIEPNSFSLQPYLKVLLVSNNHLQGSLPHDAFNGLQDVPTLDLSYSFLTAISNGSFSGMIHLNSLNISHCTIRNISYNAFIDTSNLNTLDLSHNKLSFINFNSTDMTKLKTLILHHNFIQDLQEFFFHKITNLQTLDLSHNSLIYLNDNVFSALNNIEFLDFSNNLNFTVNYEILKPLEKLKILKLSGSQLNKTFSFSQQMSLVELELSNTHLKNLSNLKVGSAIDLSDLILSHNEISSLGEAIVNMNSLQSIDLSFNKIKNLQPGSFINCTNLHLLNISHNLIKNINYGAFHGLYNLHVLDMSYNSIQSLEDTKFYQMNVLEEVIVDFNKISYLTIDQFLGTTLKILSIGSNPLPCKSLIKLRQDGYSFKITAMVIDMRSKHNYHGVACVDSYNENTFSYKTDKTFSTSEDVKILLDIRNILRDLTINTSKHDNPVPLNNLLTNANNSSTKEELRSIITLLRTSNNVTLKSNKINEEINDKIKQETEKANSLLERILKVIVAKNFVATPLPFENISNNTRYLKELKDLENNFILEKEKIISEFDNKIIALSKKIQLKTDTGYSKSPNFTEVCVALILIILVCSVAYYIYKYQLIPVGQRRKRSMSTRQISEDMDNSNL